MAPSLDVVHVASELIDCASPSLSSNRAVAERVARYLEQLGFEPIEWLQYEWPGGVDKYCVVARRGSGQRGLAFISHLDTVPAAQYHARIDGNRLYGRGACDMKGPLAAFLAAASRVEPADQTAPLYTVCTADEEVGYHGARTVATRSQLFQELARQGGRGIITEPTELAVVHGHKGTVLIEAVAHGVAAHSSTSAGDSAVLKAIPFLSVVKELYDELRFNPEWHDERFDPPWPGWNIVVSDHDTPVNVTAERCMVRVGWRPMPGQPLEPILDRVRRAAERWGLELHIAGADLQPLFIDPDSPLVQSILKLTGAAETRVVSYGTDACVLGQYMPMVVFGPGSIEQAHRSDEYIDLDQLAAGVTAYEALIRGFCCASNPSEHVPA